MEELINEYGWYVLLVALSLMFRYGMLQYKIWDSELRHKKLAEEIIIAIFVTIFISCNIPIYRKKKTLMLELLL